MINPEELKTDELYFSDKSYMSVSLWKAFEKCEEMALNGHFSPTTPMLVGSYVDAYISGTLDIFKEEHEEIFSSRGKTKGELKSEFKVAELICDKISNDDLFMKFLSGDKQTVMTGEIAEVPFKIKIDSYVEGKCIVDLKIMSSITDRNGDYIDFITPYGYDIQLACYQEIVYQNTGEKLPCYIAVATKETPINTAIIQIPQYLLDEALNKVIDSNIKRYYNVLQGLEVPIRCEKCNYCISTRTETPLISLDEIIRKGELNG